MEEDIKYDEEKINVIAHKDMSLDRLNLSFKKHISLDEFKTSHLLAYWFTDFANYHDQEKKFNPEKSGKFSKGDIVKVNLGFNIGYELGGLHYCVVLNKYDTLKNGVLTVVPLTSRKKGKKYHKSTVNLGDEIYTILKNNIEKENENLNKLLESLDGLDEIPSKIQNSISNEMKYIQKIADEVDEMKKDSIVLTNQITTISKQRLFYSPVLKNVKLSNESLDLIDKKIMQLFI